MKKAEKRSIYKTHPLNCDPTDFWGQVKRTVNGKPVTEDQIDLIVDAASDGLKISENDWLLDLCCGNGALTDRLFEMCRGGAGVDFSEPLINIAKKHFFKPPDRTYLLDDVERFTHKYELPERFTKAFCYGAFMYLSTQKASSLLRSLHNRFKHISRIYIGNLPDKDKLDHFFHSSAYTAGVENDPDSPIGIWRTQSEICQLAKETGWIAEILHMPDTFFASLYRNDAVFYRSPQK